MKKQKENKLEIRVPHNVKKVLLDRFDCSYPFLRKVPRGTHTRDQRAELIRRAAIEEGGKFILEY